MAKEQCISEGKRLAVIHGQVMRRSLIFIATILISGYNDINLKEK